MILLTTSIVFCLRPVNVKTVLFQTIQFIISTKLGDISTLDGTSLKLVDNFLPGSGRVDTAVWMPNWTLTKRLEKKLDGNYTRMLRAILKKSWRQHPTKP